MSECGPDCQCESAMNRRLEKQEKQKKRDEYRSCLVTLKSGEMLRLDFSASQLKHWRRGGIRVPIKNNRGEKATLHCRQIKTIKPTLQ